LRGSVIDFKVKNLNMSDFPAAHSMDTTWFAVDADGCVGMFDSGEGGAVPSTNTSFSLRAKQQGSDLVYVEDVVTFFSIWAQEINREIIDLNIAAADILGALGINLAELEPADSPNVSAFSEWDIPKLFWFLVLSHNQAEAEVLQIIQNHGLRDSDFIIRFTGEPSLLLFSHCPLTTVQLLFKKGLLYCARPIRSHLCNYELGVLLGLFYYSQEYQYPLPYKLRGHPVRSLFLDDLPEKLQDFVTWNWFDRLRFSEHSDIQPIEHMPCNTWGRHELWVDTQGNEREGHPHKRSKFR
jgi:hypothetical protein